MKTTRNCAVFSVYCTTALFGSSELFKLEKSDRLWIDFNYTSKSVSLLCRLKETANDREQFSILIKIENLQIDNQFDCIVLSVEPATFSTEPPTELKNARIAVFTLPENEIKRLKANRDLLDFYNKSYNYSLSDSDMVDTPNTIENYMAEGGQTEVDYSETSEDILVPLKKNVNNDLNKCQDKILVEGKSRKGNDSTAKPSLERAASKKEPTKTIKSPNIKMESGSKRTSAKHAADPDPDNRPLSNKKSCLSTVEDDSFNFKKPARPVRQKRNQNSTPKNSAELVKNIKSTQNQLQKKDAPPPASQSTQPSNRRFFKFNTNATKPTKAPLKKRNRKSVNAVDSAISSKRKKVDTVKPFNQLTKPDCDPEEAALEYVENGGYANIINFLRSDAGIRGFSEQQRQQIIENIERINKELVQSIERFFPKESGSDAYEDSTKTPSKKKRNRKTTNEVTNFVPYSAWKKNQKQQQKKTQNDQSMAVSTIQEQRSIKPILNEFDQLKLSLKVNETTTITNNMSSNGSDSSCSNHNFDINASDDEMVVATSDEEFMSNDMECRREPVETAQSPIPLPIAVSQRKAANPTKQSDLSSSQTSLYLDVDEAAPNQFELMQLDHNTTTVSRRNSEVSEIFEDLEETTHNVANFQHMSQSISDSEPENNQQLQVLSVHSSTILEQEPMDCSIPPDIHTQSDQHHTINNWYTKRYLTEQQLYKQPPHSSHAYPTSSELPPEINSVLPFVNPQPQNVTRNQVIIQNQFLVSTARERIIPAGRIAFPLARLPIIGDHEESLKGYGNLLPNYIKQVTAERNRLLEQLELSLREDFFNNFNEIVNEMLALINEHEIAINEAQEQLSFIFGKLEWLIESQQKNKSKLESLCCELIGRIKGSYPKGEEIGEAYDEMADKLQNYATVTGCELWQNFANEIIGSIGERLKGLVHL